VLLLLSVAGMGSSPAQRPPTEDEIAATLRAAIEEAALEPEPVETVMFEGIDSHAVVGRRVVRLQIAQGTGQPLRDGDFLIVNRLHVTLRGVRLTVRDDAPGTGRPGPAALGLLAAVLSESLTGLLGDGAPREYSVATVGYAVLERHVGQVAFQPLEAILDTGGRRVELRAASALSAPDGRALLLNGLVLQTSSGQRLLAEEASLQPSGELFVLSGWALEGPGRRRGGEPGVFVVTPDARRILARGPLPPGALAAATAAPDLGASDALQAFVSGAFFRSARGGTRS
jgi:hypothetical protein